MEFPVDNLDAFPDTNFGRFSERRGRQHQYGVAGPDERQRKGLGPLEALRGRQQDPGCPGPDDFDSQSPHPLRLGIQIAVLAAPRPHQVLHDVQHLGDNQPDYHGQIRN